ncbi:multidrug resistance-associated ABC transporter [Amylostereum chailletii]|nr:multidrug resistance-associated ABC transporter [Amylostereum chailletii]
MPRFQLAVAIFLAATVFASLFFFWLLRSKEGKIQLPVHEGDSVYEHDPFQVTSPEEVVDGESIDEAGFWAWVRLRKVVMVVMLSAIVGLQTVSLGYSAGLDMTQDTITYALHTFFALYILVLAVISLPQTSRGPHTQTVVHISCLSVVASLLLGITAIIPRTRLHTSLFAPAEDNNTLRSIWYSIFALYIGVCANALSTPLGPALHFPKELIYSEKTVAAITNQAYDNVSGVTGASMWDILFFSYTTKVVMLGNTAESLDIGDLPIVPADMRATDIFQKMRTTMRTINVKRFMFWKVAPGSGWELACRLLSANKLTFIVQMVLAASGAFLYYGPPWFLRRLVEYLEEDPDRDDRSWGWVYCIGLFASTAAIHLVTGQLWSVSTTNLQVRFRIQLNSVLYAKTLVRKDIASSAPPASEKDKDKKAAGDTPPSDEKDKEDDFSSKAQIMTLMTTDVDRVSEFAFHLFTLVDAPLEIIIGTFFLYNLLGVSSFFGLAVSCLFLPLNHFAGKVVVGAQDNLMKARDERVSLMNEVLGAIRMLKFMAWERSFEKRVLKIREQELKYQQLNYAIETLWNAIWSGSPILVTLAAFFHYVVIRGEPLTPSIAFTSVFFNEMRFALNAVPETLINMLQSLVSLRRIEKYLHGTEVEVVPPLGSSTLPVAFRNATITWPQDRSRSGSSSISVGPSAASTPRSNKFILVDLSLDFPKGELSLVCGKLGSGKTLLLLSLLGEVDLLTGQVSCPRTPPDAIASFTNVIPKPEDWIVEGVCAYVPQSAWLRNASIKDNILFNLPFDEERYQRTLEVCALVNDLRILEDGDESEIGEHGVNLSGGQKARGKREPYATDFHPVSLARAVYSRASVLLLDDVLSAVDAHTAHHLYHECLKGDLMRGRTVILVSHHVQLCATGASYVVALDNGRVLYEGDREAFLTSGVVKKLVQSAGEPDDKDKQAAAEVPTIEEEIAAETEKAGLAHASAPSEASSTVATASTADVKPEKKAPRKLVDEETRAVGRISRDVWAEYISACGNVWYWIIFGFSLLLAAASPVAENGWLTIWSRSGEKPTPHTPLFYIGVYGLVTGVGIILGTIRWFILYNGSIRASTVLYKRLLETVLFANIRFHDTVSRGRLLNRFGKDFEGIDSSLADNFGRSIMYGLSAAMTLVTITYVGGPPFLISALALGSLYYKAAKVYGQTSRDMRRLDSVTRSPLYSIYGETISGVTILRAFGASSKFLRDMLRCVDTNTNPYYWMWGVNRWLSIRFNMYSAGLVGVTGVVAVMSPKIDAALAGFTLAFASNVTNDILFLVRRFVSLEQSMFIEPRPAADWPSEGKIECKGLVIRYAPDLPDVLHDLNFSIKPGEKVGILGRTGSGKSTLALSFFRFVEATEGIISVDGIDISKIGLTDLRSKLTIIPQEPTILSGTLRSTLDVFDEYEDAEIYEALRRVHLIPSEDDQTHLDDSVNTNVFRNLDSPVSEGGENFSTGEKQLLCMARAILKRSRVLVMDEATASVDYATDELISKTIRHQFENSTILTIAHRLRTVIDYNRVMLLEEGRIMELDTPAKLLADPTSRFYGLCKATGKEEFAVLKNLAGIQ